MEPGRRSPRTRPRWRGGSRSTTPTPPGRRAPTPPAAPAPRRRNRRGRHRADQEPHKQQGSISCMPTASMGCRAEAEERSSPRAARRDVPDRTRGEQPSDSEQTGKRSHQPGDAQRRRLDQVAAASASSRVSGQGHLGEQRASSCRRPKVPMEAQKIRRSTRRRCVGNPQPMPYRPAICTGMHGEEALRVAKNAVAPGAGGREMPPAARRKVGDGGGPPGVAWQQPSASRFTDGGDRPPGRRRDERRWSVTTSWRARWRVATDRAGPPTLDVDQADAGQLQPPQDPLGLLGRRGGTGPRGAIDSAPGPHGT